MNQEDKNDIIDRRKKCAVKLICFTRFSNCDSFIEIKLLALLCMAVFAETCVARALKSYSVMRLKIYAEH